MSSTQGQESSGNNHLDAAKLQDEIALDAALKLKEKYNEEENPLKERGVDVFIDKLKKLGLTGALAYFVSGSETAAEIEEKERKKREEDSDNIRDVLMEFIINDLEESLKKYRDDLTLELSQVERETDLSNERIRKLQYDIQKREEVILVTTQNLIPLAKEKQEVETALQAAKEEREKAQEQEKTAELNMKRAKENEKDVSGNMLQEFRGTRRISIEKGVVSYVSEDGTKKEPAGMLASGYYKFWQFIGRKTLEDQTKAQTELVSAEVRYKEACDISGKSCQLVDTLTERQKEVAEKFEKLAKFLNEEKEELKRQYNELKMERDHNDGLKLRHKGILDKLKKVDEAIDACNDPGTRNEIKESGSLNAVLSHLSKDQRREFAVSLNNSSPVQGGPNNLTPGLPSPTQAFASVNGSNPQTGQNVREEPSPANPVFQPAAATLQA